MPQNEKRNIQNTKPKVPQLRGRNRPAQEREKKKKSINSEADRKSKDRHKINNNKNPKDNMLIQKSVVRTHKLQQVLPPLLGQYSNQLG